MGLDAESANILVLRGATHPGRWASDKRPIKLFYSFWITPQPEKVPMSASGKENSDLPLGPNVLSRFIYDILRKKTRQAFLIVPLALPDILHCEESSQYNETDMLPVPSALQAQVEEGLRNKPLPKKTHV
jgi:hypothetical protein